MIKNHGYPMVLNVVIHRYNIGHMKEILEMAEALGADYIELANTQYYGWSLVNRSQLMPLKEQVEEAERITNEFREKAGSKMKIFLWCQIILAIDPKMYEWLGRSFHDCHCKW